MLHLYYFIVFIFLTSINYTYVINKLIKKSTSENTKFPFTSHQGKIHGKYFITKFDTVIANFKVKLIILDLFY